MISYSEARRQKRIDQKLAETTCFACREKGHAAKDCPTVQKSTEDDDGEEEKTETKVVGICYRWNLLSQLSMGRINQTNGTWYRCGSKKHNLSRCKKPSDPTNPYPYASCFVCQGKGHLASACPQNKSKGVYPNGGSCKLCGDTSHLAKDCSIRQKGEFDITAPASGEYLLIFQSGQPNSSVWYRSWSRTGWRRFPYLET